MKKKRLKAEVKRLKEVVAYQDACLSGGSERRTELFEQVNSLTCENRALRAQLHQYDLSLDARTIMKEFQIEHTSRMKISSGGRWHAAASSLKDLGLITFVPSEVPTLYEIHLTDLGRRCDLSEAST